MRSDCVKKAYRQPEDAMMAMEFNRKHHGFPLQEVYFCNKCGYYHLTTMKKKENEDERNR